MIIPIYIYLCATLDDTQRQADQKRGVEWRTVASLVDASNSLGFTVVAQGRTSVVRKAVPDPGVTGLPISEVTWSRNITTFANDACAVCCFSD
jgi:hypothetical protein